MWTCPATRWWTCRPSSSTTTPPTRVTASCPASSPERVDPRVLGVDLGQRRGAPPAPVGVQVWQRALEVADVLGPGRLGLEEQDGLGSQVGHAVGGTGDDGVL